MNQKQAIFVECYVKHWDGLKAMQQAGYNTENRRSAQSTLRRLLEREDIKSIISNSVETAEYGDMNDKEGLIAYCIQQMKNNDRHSATFMGHLLKLRGWDKGDQEDTQAEPPKFSRMPFQPCPNVSELGDNSDETDTKPHADSRRCET